jgi:hypothetical protein
MSRRLLVVIPLSLVLCLALRAPAVAHTDTVATSRASAVASSGLTANASTSSRCLKRGARLTFAAGLSCLKTRGEYGGTYNRSALFGSTWIDANGDGLNTRADVLIAESTIPVTMRTSGKTVGSGRWYSLYDNLWVTSAAALDIDHLVPLAEVWRSGASSWSSDRRLRYANDIGVPWTLRAVSSGPNRAKGDKDPASWMPSFQGAWCTYLVEWVDVKIRWRLAVDATERSAMQREWAQAGCAQRVSAPLVTIALAP